MATLSEIVAVTRRILDDPAYTEPLIVEELNKTLQRVAAGIRMPDGGVSPPLPDLHSYGTVTTSLTLPYVSLPTDYQREVVRIYDSTGNRYEPPRGGDYYAYNLFLRQIARMDLVEAGEIYALCVRGTRLYYQGIPMVATTIGLHYYRKPAVLALDGDVPDGIPEHLAEDILKHGVLKEIFGEKIEDCQDNSGIGTKYHSMKFYEVMTDLVDFIGTDGEPQYYGSGGFEDRGVCD